MQVNMHGIDRAETKSYRDEELYAVPFVLVTLVDGKGSETMVYLTCVEDAVKLAEVAKEALALWAGVEAMRKPEHIDYPHQPGYLHDCPACEHECFCTRGNLECVFEGNHNGTGDKWEDD